MNLYTSDTSKALERGLTIAEFGAQTLIFRKPAVRALDAQSDTTGKAADIRKSALEHFPATGRQ